MKEQDLTDKEKELFSQLKRETMPPSYLEKRISNQLKSENLIHTTMKTSIIWATAIAAATLLFFAGKYYGKHSKAIDPQMGYMFVLYENDQFTPEDGQQMFNEYSDWAYGVLDNGRRITGQELNDSGVLVEKGHTQPVKTDGKFISGYFLIEANSLEDAVQVAQSSPHIKYGGSIEVKQFRVR